MPETRKLAAILAADVAGYSKLAGADEERTLARLRTLWSDLIAPTIAVHHGRVVKRTGDGSIIEFRSVVDAVRCAIEVQNGMAERNTGLPPERRIEFRVGIHVGDVVEESDGDLMGDGVNIAARLEGIAEPGGICLSEDAYRQVRGKISQEFSDLGEQQLKNIAQPVRAYEVKAGPARLATPPQVSTPDKASPPRLSIVVLPFTNIGGGSEQEYFVDGVTESLTTDLSRIAGSFVIARNTAFTYKGKPFDVKQIGRELTVRYVLEGSVQRSGSRMRVNVQLIDAETGAHLWADRFDKPVADILDMQDEIVANLANRLGTELIAAEARRAEQAPNPDSRDLYYQGLAWFNKGPSGEYLAHARSFFERAIALDPDNLDASIGTAQIDAILCATYQTDDRGNALARAEMTLTRALLRASNNAVAHQFMGLVLVQTKRVSEGIAEYERSLALDPNLAESRGLIGLAKIFDGRAEETEQDEQEALRLSPRDKNAWAWMHFSGSAKLYLGADEEAVVWFRRAIGLRRDFPLSHFWLAAALANLDRMEEARAEVQVGLTLDPTFTIRRFLGRLESDKPVFLRQRQRHTDGLRKAGVPEG
jgi:TolB-like protein/class 3 adenylate cyclase/Flp pilus assembly protein TadD